MKTRMKTSLCLILILALCLSVVPVQAAWYDAGAQFAEEYGLLEGMGHSFEPNAAAERALLVTALWKLDGSKTADSATAFSDVEADAWYAGAAGWAKANGIVTGYSDGSFGALDTLTREQFAAMLYRYAGYLDMDVSVGEDTNILSYADAFDWSEYAVASLQWAVGAGILQGTDGGRLDARGTLTQAQTFTMLERFDRLGKTLSMWTDAAPAKTALTAYMEAITDPDSPDFIPVTDRIAVFDLDGTLMCETYPRCFEYMVFVDYTLNNPKYTPTAEVKAVAQEIMDTRWQEKPSGISTRQAAAAAIAYKGMTPAELEAYVTDFMNSDAEGFTGLKRGEAFYIPMVEMVKFLEANDFTVYIVTATERNIVRALVKNALGIPPARVIGTEYGYTATGQGETADGDYTFQPSDKVVFDGNYYGENAKMSKVDAIVREIGQQPVLAFGNSSGDIAMCEYVVTNNPYSALSYIVLADDETREWGDAEDAKAKIADYTALGIGTISMRDDFKTIYGNGVEKDTGAPNR